MFYHTNIQYHIYFGQIISKLLQTKYIRINLILKKNKEFEKDNKKNVKQKFKLFMVFLTMKLHYQRLKVHSNITIQVVFLLLHTITIPAKNKH